MKDEKKRRPVLYVIESRSGKWYFNEDEVRNNFNGIYRSPLDRFNYRANTRKAFYNRSYRGERYFDEFGGRGYQKSSYKYKRNDWKSDDRSWNWRAEDQSNRGRRPFYSNNNGWRV